MIFTKEQVEAMSCFKTNYEEIHKLQASLFNDENDWYIFVRTESVEDKESDRVFIPFTKKQKEVVKSPLYKEYQAKLDQIKEEIKPMVRICSKTLKENFHLVVEDIKQYGESIFELDSDLFSKVHQNISPRLEAHGIEIARNICTYYLSEFYINRFDDIEIVLDAEVNTNSHVLLSEFVDLLGKDKYVSSIIEKHLEKINTSEN